MVCIYCDSRTHVVNSRPKKRSNSIWRRRVCVICEAVFTSSEQVAYDSLLVVQSTASHIVPFQRDLLFLSIYDACRHRKTATADATALTDTVLGTLLSLGKNQGILKRNDIVQTANRVLGNFDKAACVHYLAFHPL